MNSRATLSTFALLLLALGCDRATPTAPKDAVLTLTVNPSEISQTETATVTVQAVKSTGLPVNPGSEIQLTTTLGVLGKGIITTDDRGVATTTLRGDGRNGDAKVTAFSGGAKSNEVTVKLGRLGANVTLQATPSVVPVLDNSADTPDIPSSTTIALQAVIRDAQGQPLAGATANFVSPVGTLKSGGAFRTSNAQGVVTDTLTITAFDIDSFSGTTFNITVQVSGTSGVISDDAGMTIGRKPRADFTFTQNRLVVSFRYQASSTGSEPTAFLWTFGEPAGSDNTSTSRDPTHQYAAPGSYTVTLKVSNSLGSDETSRIVTVTNQ